MGLFDGFSGWFGGGSSFGDSGTSVNPASGLKVVDGSMIDVAGNPYGADSSNSFSAFNDDDPLSSFGGTSMFNNDGSGSSISSFGDDSFSSFDNFGGGGFSDDGF